MNKKKFNSLSKIPKWAKGATGIGKNAKTAIGMGYILMPHDPNVIILRSHTLEHIYKCVKVLNEQNVPIEDRYIKLPMSLIEVI